MRSLIQRVTRADVSIEGKISGKIDKGLVILLGIEERDTTEDVEWLVHKIINLRIFSDENGKMNQSLLDIDGEVLIISQFTLHAKTKKGHRPSYIRAAKPEFAIPLYEYFISEMGRKINHPPQTGKFGAMMDVSLVNHGPVTIFIDTKNKE